jgi:hydrogenase expression/formation protein HypE
MNKQVRLGHGSGGELSHALINDIFYKHFTNPHLDAQTDAAVLHPANDNVAFTTDGHVVNPLFFPGGSIGTLAVCGTVNDLAVTGARPRWLSASFIIEEGFALDDLETVVIDMATRAKEAGVMIVTGDTKVVEKGACDGLFVTTAGIGEFITPWYQLQPASGPQPGDALFINGSIGDHGISIMAAREGIKMESPVFSDCAALTDLIEKACALSSNIHFARDATRGGLATVLVEMARNFKKGIDLDESSLVIDQRVGGLCELLGFDPLYLANEGKVVMAAPLEDAEKIVEQWRDDPLGKNSAIIGRVVDEHPGKVVMQTEVGGRRIVDMLSGEQLPRIC